MQITIPPNLAISDQAYADAYAEGARLERARIVAILGAPASAERPALARKVALNTDMAVDAALDFIAGLPAERAVSSIPSLAERHAAAGPGAGYEGPGGAEAAAADANRGTGIMQKAAAKIAAKRAAHDQGADACSAEGVSPMQAAAARVAAGRDEA